MKIKKKKFKKKTTILKKRKFKKAKNKIKRTLKKRVKNKKRVVLKKRKKTNKKNQKSKLKFKIKKKSQKTRAIVSRFLSLKVGDIGNYFTNDQQSRFERCCCLYCMVPTWIRGEREFP